MTTPKAGITTLQIDGVTITKDIAKQLDELNYEHWENFAPLGRIRTGRDYGMDGLEIIGRNKSSGALVRMWHITGARRTGMQYTVTTTPDGSIHLEGETLPDDDRRDRLTREYGQLPLIILPKESRP